jgi:SagB-type dehydrogenase family enzyme
MLRYDDPLTLSLLFHLNSEPWNNVAAYNDPHARTEFKTVESTGESVPLPASQISPLTRLLAARRSCREFAQLPIMVDELAAILDAGLGITDLRKFPGGAHIFGRSAPSAGGLNAIECYVACNRVASAPTGIYHFNVPERRLEFVGSCTLSEMLPDLMYQCFLEAASALLLLAAVLPRSVRKYGSRGYRYVLIEAGHIAQNVCLRAAELGLETLCVGGFVDHKINRRLRLDGRTEVVLYGVAVGHGHSLRMPESE